MKFSMKTKEMREVFESIQVKGKYASSTGFTSSSLGATIHLILQGNNLVIFNGNTTFIARANISVAGEEDGTCTCDVLQILSYLKTFGESVVFQSADFITLTSGNKKATVPYIIGHDTSIYNTITQTLGLDTVAYEVSPTQTKVGKFSFEGIFSVTSDDFASCMQSMELVKAGTYKLDFGENHEVKFSSRKSTENRYEEVLTSVHSHGEPATIEFTSPIHKFFNKGQLLNFFVKDEFPILIMANDRLLLKAPSISN